MMARRGLRRGQRLAAVPALLLSASLALGVALPGQAVRAQSTGLPQLGPAMPVVTLEQDRLFTATLYGKALQKLLDGEVAAQNAENRKLEAELEAEELDLTDRRPKLAPAEFRQLAEAFDAKAEDTRKRQAAKARALSERQDDLRNTFYERVTPVLAEVMAERGAVAIIDKKAIIIAFGRIDITDAAIARIDAVLGDGSGPRRDLRLQPRATAPVPDAPPQEAAPATEEPPTGSAAPDAAKPGVSEPEVVPPGGAASPDAGSAESGGTEAPAAGQQEGGQGQAVPAEGGQGTAQP